MSIVVLLDLIGDLLPPGVLNVVNGFWSGSRQAAGHQQPHQ